MIDLQLTSKEAMKLRALLAETCTDMILANIYNKLDRALKQPAVKRKFKPHDMPRIKPLGDIDE